MFGDCDDGYVLDLAGGGNDVRELLSVGAVLFERPDFRPMADGSRRSGILAPGFRCAEAVGCASLAPEGSPASIEGISRIRALSSPMRKPRGEDRVSVLFDCAELGYGSIAAHGHADALSFTLRVGGRDVFVDPGTFDYFTYPEWRTYFRTTASHNTLEIDGRDQSAMLGPFLWGSGRSRGAPGSTRRDRAGSSAASTTGTQGCLLPRVIPGRSRWTRDPAS